MSLCAIWEQYYPTEWGHLESPSIYIDLNQAWVFSNLCHQVTWAPDAIIPTNPINAKLNWERTSVGVAVSVGAALAAIDVDVLATELEEADKDALLLEVVVEDTVFSCCVVEGGGVDVVWGGVLDVVLGAWGGGDPPPPKVHEPVMMPSDSDAKKLKRPVEKSRPPKGHPGHWWNRE
jgi:hypothetical protein